MSSSADDLIAEPPEQAQQQHTQGGTPAHGAQASSASSRTSRQQQRVLYAHYLVVCTGLHTSPLLPEVKDQELFQGQVSAVTGQSVFTRKQARAPRP